MLTWLTQAYPITAVSSDTLYIVLSVVFSAGAVYMRIGQLEKRVARMEKQLDEHIIPTLIERG